jgi:hypothetical protein
MVDYRAEAQYQERERAAAEAREKELLTWLGDEWRHSCSESSFCALCGAYEADGHEPGCPWKELRESDHAALDAAIEHAQAEALKPWIVELEKWISDSDRDKYIARRLLRDMREAMREGDDE